MRDYVWPLLLAAIAAAAIIIIGTLLEDCDKRGGRLVPGYGSYTCVQEAP